MKRKTILLLGLVTVLLFSSSAAAVTTFWNNAEDPAAGSFSVSPDSEKVAAVMGDGVVKLYESDTGETDFEYSSMDARNVHALNEKMYVISDEQVVKVDYKEQTQQWVNTGVTGDWVYYSEEQDAVYTINQAGNVSKMNPDTGELIDETNLPSGTSAYDDEDGNIEYFYGSHVSFDSKHQTIKILTKNDNVYYIDADTMSEEQIASLESDNYEGFDTFEHDGQVYDVVRGIEELWAVEHGEDTGTNTPLWRIESDSDREAEHFASGAYMNDLYRVTGTNPVTTSGHDVYIYYINPENGDIEKELYVEEEFFNEKFNYDNEDQHAYIQAEQGVEIISYFRTFAGVNQGHIERLNPEIEQDASDTYALNGTVTDNQGNDVPNATINFEHQEYSDYSYTVETNDNGTYETDVLSGTYNVEVRSSDFARFTDKVEVTENTTYDIELTRDSLDIRINNWVQPGTGGSYSVIYENYTTDETTDVTGNATVVSSDTSVLEFLDAGEYQSYKGSNTSVTVTAQAEGITSQETVVVADQCIENIDLAENNAQRLSAYMCTGSIDNSFTMLLFAVITSSAVAFMLTPVAGVAVGVLVLGITTLTGFAASWLVAVGFLYLTFILTFKYGKRV